MFECLKVKKKVRDEAKAEEAEFPREINEVIVHCSATPDATLDKPRFRGFLNYNGTEANWYDLEVEEIKQWHLERGFSDTGYHIFIRRDGTREVGRPLEKAGAHCLGRNAHSIGICLAGSHSYTEAQKKTLREEYKIIRSRFGLTSGSWFCHNDFSNKECPGFNRSALLEILDVHSYSLGSS